MILNPIEVYNKRTYKGPGEYLGRPNPLGNPFTHLTTSKIPGIIVVQSREIAVQECDKWLDAVLYIDGPPRNEFARLLAIYRATGSLKLICWCVPELCHATSIARRLEVAAGRVK